MSGESVAVITYPAPPFDRGEIYRYAGMKEDSPAVSALADECIAEVETRLVYKVCYREMPVCVTGGSVDFGFFRADSVDLAKNLSGCDRAVIFAATVGLEMDRLIAKYGKISPSKALLFQAVGAERIEALCDRFNREIAERAAEERRCTRPRFSPGYGDFSLEAQRAIFRLLDAPKNIGVSLNESLLMTPSKSVTAVIGIGDNGGSPLSCKNCRMKDCLVRRKK